MPHFSNRFAARTYQNPARRNACFFELMNAAWANSKADGGSSALRDHEDIFFFK
jgi:hypothetical protein